MAKEPLGSQISPFCSLYSYFIHWPHTARSKSRTCSRRVFCDFLNNNTFNPGTLCMSSAKTWAKPQKDFPGPLGPPKPMNFGPLGKSHDLAAADAMACLGCNKICAFQKFP